MIFHLIKNSINFYKKRTFLLLLQNISVYLIIIFLLGFTYESKINMLKLNKSTSNIYKVSDNLMDDEERRFFSQSNYLSILDDFYNWSKTNDNFMYIIANQQPISLEKNLPAQFLYTLNQLNVYKSLQVNQNFIDHFSIEVETGNLFTNQSYSIDNKIIPILLGSNYKNYFELNEKIFISYMGINLECKVLGFLKENSYYNNSYNLQYLDDYIILPSLEYQNYLEYSESFIKKLLLDKCSGYIVTKLSPKYIQSIYTKKCFELDIIPYTINNISSFNLTMWGLEGEQLEKIFASFSILIILSTIICISIIQSSKIIDYTYYYCIMIINGFSKNTIIISNIIEILFINIFSLLLSCLLLNNFITYINFIILFLFSIFITLLSSIYPYIVIKRIKLTKELKRGN